MVRTLKTITTPNVKNPSGLPPQSAQEPAGGVRSAVKGIFRKDGEFWTVGYGEKVFRLKDSTGLAYIGYMLRYPGTEFHVLDLGTHGTSGPEASDDKAQLSPAGVPKNSKPREYTSAIWATPARPSTIRPRRLTSRGLISRRTLFPQSASNLQFHSRVHWKLVVS